MCWFLYLIRTADNRLYTGITTDVSRRFCQHQTGKGAKALRGKGEMEEALIAQQWPRLTIARPSMLVGEREKKRTGETLLAPLFSLLPGNLKSIDARDVASALLAEALSPAQEGVRILSSSQLRERATRAGDY